MAGRKGILLTSEFDLMIKPVKKNGLIISGLVVGDSMDQDVVVILKLQQGELKEDPLCGAGLTKFMRGKYDKSQIDDRIRIHLTRMGIDYEEYKKRLSQTFKTQE